MAPILTKEEEHEQLRSKQAQWRRGRAATVGWKSCEERTLEGKVGFELVLVE